MSPPLADGGLMLWDELITFGVDDDGSQEYLALWTKAQVVGQGKSE